MFCFYVCNSAPEHINLQIKRFKILLNNNNNNILILVVSRLILSVRTIKFVLFQIAMAAKILNLSL